MHRPPGATEHASTSQLRRVTGLHVGRSTQWLSVLQPVATGAQKDFPSHCCPWLLLVTALRAGSGLSVVSAVPGSTGEEAL